MLDMLQLIERYLLMDKEKFMQKKVLVVAPSRKTRGGITAVIKAYEETSIWSKWNCKWVETYRDTSIIIKIWYFLKSLLRYLIILPQCEIVHIHISWSTSAFRKFPFFICAKIFRKKVIIHLHSGDDMIVKAKFQFLYRNLFLNADHTILLAESIKNKLIDHYRFKKVSVVYNPCPEKNKETEKVKNNDILFAGTLYHIKGYSDLIEAFSLIAKKLPEWKIVFAGNGEIEEAKQLAKKFHIENQVIFKGWVLAEEKDILFKESSFLCLPSYTEGFPMAVLDAWAYGLPVITTPVGGLPDVLKHGENALVFEPGDINSLASNLVLLIENEKLRKKLSGESIKLSKNEFNLQNIAKQLDELYTELLTNHQ
jgi:glycosyltransferase involved in cell wall biosynthesis